MQVGVSSIYNSLWTLLLMYTPKTATERWYGRPIFSFSWTPFYWGRKRYSGIGRHICCTPFHWHHFGIHTKVYCMDIWYFPFPGHLSIVCSLRQAVQVEMTAIHLAISPFSFLPFLLFYLSFPISSLFSLFPLHPSLLGLYFFSFSFPF